MDRISLVSVCALLCVATAACGTLVPLSELPTAATRDLDCDGDVQIHRSFWVGTVATGCGRSHRYRCKSNPFTGETRCEVHGEESYGVVSDEWVHALR